MIFRAPQAPLKMAKQSPAQTNLLLDSQHEIEYNPKPRKLSKSAVLVKLGPRNP
jgi:hypothetical protein